MKTFLRLNRLSALYAFVLFISIELQVNFYRICRLTGWEGDTVNSIIAAIHIVGFIVTMFLFYTLVRKWFKDRIIVYWSVILWLPYVILFVFLFATLFPMTNQGDRAAPVSGLIIIGQLFVYPFYLSIVTMFGSASDIVVEEVRG